MDRRELLKGFLAMPLAAAELYAQRTRGLPPLLIKEVQVIPTSAGGRIWLGFHQDHHQRARTVWNRIGQ